MSPIYARLIARLTAVFAAYTEGDRELAIALWVNAVQGLNGEMHGCSREYYNARDYCYAVHAFLRGCPHYMTGRIGTAL